MPSAALTIEAARDRLGGLSLAEWEYAYRFVDHLSVDDVKPDAAGFDPERIALSERILRLAWGARIARIRRRR